ncbi:MAG: flagellar assembly protein FliW, partial [Planctomycetales bacterium]
VDPRRFVSDYLVRLDAVDWNPLGATPEDAMQVLTIVTRQQSRFTVNLLAPLVINRRRRLGRQVVNVGHWPIDHLALDLNTATKKIA